MSEDHYFSADPSVAFQRQPVVASVWGHDLELVSGSGVFARGRVDIGTSILFRETEPPTGGRILDLGCGYGVIGLACAVAAPDAVVTAVDVNQRALLLAGENAASLGVSDRFVAVLPDQVDPGATYDEIWSNPPIRIGKQELHALLLHWLPRLAPGGRAWLVVQKNLGSDSLQSWMQQTLPDLMGPVTVTREASSKGFRVLSVHRSSTAS